LEARGTRQEARFFSCFSLLAADFLLLASFVSPNAFCIAAAVFVIPASFAYCATSSSATKHLALPPNLFSLSLLIPTSTILTSVIISAPFEIASMPASIAPLPNLTKSAYSKSAVVWMSLFTIGNSNASNLDSSSCSLIRRKLSASMGCCPAKKLEAGGWRLEAGGWRPGIGDEVVERVAGGAAPGFREAVADQRCMAGDK